MTGRNSRAASPEPQSSVPAWFSPGGRDLLEQLGQYPKLSPFDQLQFQSPAPTGEARGQPIVKHEFDLPSADRP